MFYERVNVCLKEKWVRFCRIGNKKKREKLIAPVTEDRSF